MTTTRDYLDELEAQLVALTPELAGNHTGAEHRRRPWRRLEMLALVPALAAAAAIVVVLLASVGSSPRARHHQIQTPATHRSRVHHPAHHASTHHAVSRHHRSTNPTAPHAAIQAPPSGPVPAGFSAESFTAVSELRWWLLGRAPCSSPPCTSIVRTDDGGRRFAGIPAPRTDQVSQLRFAASGVDGFAYGPQLWVTHDSGAHWHRVDLGGTVSSLEPAGGYVYAIVRSADGHGSLRRSPVGSDSWSPLAAAGNAETGLWVEGQDVLLESAGARAQQLMVSHDAGATFTAYTAPPDVACQFEEKPGAIWAPCATGTMSGVWRSGDGGATFAAAGGDASRDGFPPEPNSAAFAAATGTTAVLGSQRLYRTTDGGAHWSAVPTVQGLQGITYLGFTDATHGAAIVYLAGSSAQQILYTTDAGASYHQVVIR